MWIEGCVQVGLETSFGAGLKRGSRVCQVGAREFEGKSARDVRERKERKRDRGDLTQRRGRSAKHR